MKKRIIILIIAIHILLSLIYLSIFFFAKVNAEFPFEENLESIVSVEIVEAESILKYTVLKTIPETESQVILDELQSIGCNVQFGSPPPLNGNAIKITYDDGSYDMLSAYSYMSYHNEEKWGAHSRCCADPETFETLIAKYLEE